MTHPKPTKTHVDLLIVGGGPAGLSAALMFSRLRRPTILYDSGLYRNAQSPTAHTILGHEGVNPAVYRQNARAEIEKGYEWTSFVNGKITSLVKGAEGFEAEDAEGNKISAKSVILATGVRDILPSIPGLQEAWGTRAIHCVFCHGTETRDQPFGFLLTRANANFNPMIVASGFKLWNKLLHPKTYFFTHGMDINTPEDLTASGLEKFMPIIKANPDKYEIITNHIESTSQTPSEINIHFSNRPSLSLPYILVFPERITPSPDAEPLLTKDLLLADLSPFGGSISPPNPALAAAGMPRMGDDPRTNVPGLFWAGNSGSPMANVNLAVSHGQQAAAFAGEMLGEEDLKTLQNVAQSGGTGLDQ